MKCLKIFFLILFPISLWGQVKISVNPPTPVKGEPFLIVFDCEIKGDTEPEISFDPSGLEILGRDSRGLSTRTIYSNGKLTVTREISYVYEAVAHKTGKVSLNDINVVIDNIKHNKGNFSIDIANIRQEALPFFVSADVDNKELYVGEGINVRYYLYTKVPISSFDIKKFPKLEGFMKRFLQENDQGERVQVDGEIYRRNIIYSSRLYPEKAGRLVIDPLYFSVTYSNEQLNPFGFGFGRADQKTREIESKSIEIKVKDLPSPKPQGYTGLVGDNEITLRASSASLMVNEPYEFKLTIIGDGALENIESPAIFPEGLMENFDMRSDLKIMTAEKAQKDISYTYIAKKAGEINAGVLTLYSFSPSRRDYIAHKLTLPVIKIAGSNLPPPEKSESPESKKSLSTNNDVSNSPSLPQGLNFDSTILFRPLVWLSFFALLSIVLLLFKFKPLINESRSLKKNSLSLNILINGKGSYGDWLRIIDSYLPGYDSEIKRKIENSSLSLEAKNQLKSAFMLFENAQFSGKKQEVQVKLAKNVVSELQKIKKSVNDEDL
jgi:hypothetical protein